ncbi:12200_t:CDS:2 [Funneliformis geosporum]|nr:12200_t:CDS:2 [Funneliformis geosporum]
MGIYMFLKTIHNANFIHRDIHSGNILFFDNYLNGYQWQIGDLGLSQPANNTSSNDGIFGVMPYIAPEVLNGGSVSKASDIYSMGMIMWELTTGYKPFANVKQNAAELLIDIIDGNRPDITEDTPECYARLMKRCWDPNPLKRPIIKEVHKIFDGWYRGKKYQFDQAEIKRLELMKHCPEIAVMHPNAVFTSRNSSSLFSRSSPIMNSLYINQGYVSKEYDFDIPSPPTINTDSTMINSSRKRNIKELKAKYSS